MKGASIVLPLAIALGPTGLARAGDVVDDLVEASDRIVLGNVLESGAGTVVLPSGRTLTLGFKDPATGAVFTPYRISVSDCLFDRAGTCPTSTTDVSFPGGTVRETVGGTVRLRTWEVAGAPAPPGGGTFLLFLARRGDRYIPLGDSRSCLPLTGGAPILARVKKLIGLRLRVPMPSSGKLHEARPADPAADGSVHPSGDRLRFR